MKHDPAVVVDLGVRSEDHPNIIGLNISQMYERLCQLEELIDKSPRVTQYQVRQLTKRVRILEEFMADIPIFYEVVDPDAVRTSADEDDPNAPALFNRGVPWRSEAGVDL